MFVIDDDDNKDKGASLAALAEMNGGKQKTPGGKDLQGQAATLEHAKQVDLQGIARVLDPSKTTAEEPVRITTIKTELMLPKPSEVIAKGQVELEIAFGRTLGCDRGAGCVGPIALGVSAVGPKPEKSSFCRRRNRRVLRADGS